MTDVIAKRQQKLARQIKQAHLDAFLVTNPLHVTYLTGFTGDSSIVLATPKRSILVSDSRFAIQIEEECPHQETHIRGHNKNTYQAVAAIISKLEVHSIGVEKNHLTLQLFDYLQSLLTTVEWSPQLGWIEELRAIKDDSEIEAIRHSIGIGEKAFEMFRLMLSDKDTEKDLHDAMEMYIRRCGGRCTGFPSIVGINERSALPHAPPTNKSMKEANFLLVDWGVCGPLYQSDLTRVIPSPFPGTRNRSRVETKLQKIYTVVLQAQKQAIATIRPGVSVKEVDTAARKLIADAGYGKNFNHGLGHGIGLQTHEAPSVRSNSNDVLQPGMVLTIEPGIYLPGFGGVRIEDDILVTPDGCEVLSNLPKEWDAYWNT